MCGIVGVIATNHGKVLDNTELNIFSNMLYCSALRGVDSTGIMIWNGEQVDTLKAPFRSSEFIYSKSYHKFLEKHKGKIMAIFGHTRFATSGKVTIENSHPFIVKNQIVLMHNGAVEKVPHVDVKDFSVDSLALAHSLQKGKSAEDTLKDFNGAAAAVWFDLRDRTLNLFRNYHRPLSLYKGIFATWIASEAEMLSWVVGRAMPHATVAPKVLTTNNILSYSIDDFKKEGELKEIGFLSSKLPSFDNFYAPNSGYNYKQSTYKNKYSSSSEEKSIILVDEHGPFKKNTELMVSPYDIVEYTHGDFKIMATPVFVTENSVTKGFENTTCLIFLKGVDKSTNFFKAPLIKGVIKNIKYDRKAEKLEDRVVIYLGDAQIIS